MDPDGLRQICMALAPSLADVIECDADSAHSTWHAPWETGKALEVVGLCLLAALSRWNGQVIDLPTLYKEHPEAFYMRNVLPHSHSRKAGHSDRSTTPNLELAFVAAFTPKLVISGEHRSWGVFREGLPVKSVLDFVLSGVSPVDRPDVIVVEGTGSTLLDGSAVSCTWGSSDFEWDWIVRVADSPVPRLIDHGAIPLAQPRVAALVESSVAKSTSHVDRQLASYLRTFGLDSLTRTMFFHGGNSSSTLAGVTVSVERLASWIKSDSGSETDCIVAREWWANCLT
jgi:hypothetical protein